MKKFLILIPLFILLSGCSTYKNDVEVKFNSRTCDNTVSVYSYDLSSAEKIRQEHCKELNLK